MNVSFSTRLGALFLALVLSVAPAMAQTAPQGIPLEEIPAAAAAFEAGPPAPAWAERIVLPPITSKDPAVVRLADTQIFVDAVPVVFMRRAIQVNDAGLLTDAGQLPIHFVPDFQRLQLHAIRIHRGGQVLDRTTSPVRFLRREKGLEQGLYSGEVTASILVNDLRVGDTLEYEVSLVGQNPVFGGKFSDWAFWDSSLPTALRRVALSHPASRRIAWRMAGPAKPVTPMETASGGIRKLQFEEANIAPIDVDALAPNDRFFFRALQFSEFATHDEVSQWAAGLFAVDGALDDELRALLARLRALPSLEERVAGALEFVQSEIRYFSVSLGENSHRPTRPMEVMKRRYGDCKDKSLLLIALLKELGVPAQPLLLNNGMRGGFDQLLPSPILFDHVIVQATAGGVPYFLDPTRLGQHGRLARMGQFFEGAQGLLVGPPGRGFVTIASPKVDELARNEMHETASLDRFGGDGQLRVQQTWNGVSAEILRAMRAQTTREQFDKMMSEPIERRYPGARLSGDSSLQDDRQQNSVVLTAQYTIPRMAQDRENAWVVRFSPSNMRNTLMVPPSTARSTPIAQTRFPFEARYVFEMRFPDEVSIVSDPRAQSVENKHFRQTVTSSFRGNLARVSVDHKTLRDRVEVADLPKYVEDVRAADAAIGGALTVYKAHFKTAGRAGLARKGFAETLRERLEDRTQKISVAIQSGKLAGPDLATAHCGRAETYAQLGRNDEALNDANQAVKLAPNAPEMLACRGFARFKAGQFDASLADYTSAVTLGATDPRTFHTRGLANFYGGRMEAAAADFARAADTNDREAQVYADLWQVWTSQRLNRPVPAAVAQRAAAQPRGEWPRPALAMAVNALPPEEALRAAESKSGDDRVMAMTEGYFYLGQHYLGRGDTARAQDYFERTVRQGILIYNENDAAQFELTRMGVAIPAVTSTPSATATPARAPAPSRVMEDKPRSEETRSSN